MGMDFKLKDKKIGILMLVVGTILAVIAGIFVSMFFSIPLIISLSTPIYAVLLFFGLIIGFTIDVEGKHSQLFLIVLTMLVVVSKFGMESVGNSLLGITIRDTVISTFSALLVLFVPATLVLAIRTVFSVVKI